MGRISYRSRNLVPLLFLLLVGGTAAAPLAESLYRDAQAASARGDLRTAGTIASNALKQLGNSDDELAWRLRILYADVLFAQSGHEQGRVVLQRPLPPKLSGSDIEVLRLRGLAVAALRLSEDSTADVLIRKAHALAKKRPRTLPSVLLVLATLDRKNSDEWAREAVRLSQKYGDAQTEIRARGTIGRTLALQERFDEALAIWEPALKQARSLGNESLVQKFEGNLGWAYIELGDYETAGVLFRAALARATRVGARYELVPWNFQLGNIRLQEGDVEGAQKYYRVAYNLAVETKHWQKAIVLSYMANAALLSGRIKDAQRYADASLEERKKDKDPEPALRSLMLTGRVLTASGRLDDAERRLREVLARSKSPQTLWETHGRLAQLYVKAGNASAAEVEFRRAVKTARTVRESVSDDELRLSFFTAMVELFDSNIDFLIARGRAPDALAVTETSRAQTLGDALPDVAAPRDVRIIARETGATILCYWLGSTRSYLWIVTPKKVDVVVLPPQREIEAAVDTYQRDLLGARGSLNMSGARGVALWQMLVGRASSSIPPRSRVIVVPHGRLAAFNMETLVVPTPKPHYWIDDVVLSTAGSLGLLVRKGPKRTAAPRLLLVGNAPPPAREFAALPRAGVEMDKVARHFDPARSVILSGAKATPSAYRSASPAGFTNLHFVAHGVATRLKPLDSAVVLARDGDSFKLYARDIAKQPLTARLVTISSCHGAGTRAYAGEGLVGLGWAFLRAGADNVVAALWEVSDAATPVLMDRFYANLAKGADPATALRDAKLSLVHGGGVYARPLYWAPFLLYGSS